jgi:hypothetical protein
MFSTSKRDTRRINNQSINYIMTREQEKAFLKENAEELVERFNDHIFARDIKLSEFEGENLKRLKLGLLAILFKQMLEERGLA